MRRSGEHTVDFNVTQAHNGFNETTGQIGLVNVNGGISTLAHDSVDYDAYDM